MYQHDKEAVQYEAPALRRVGQATDVIRGIASYGDDLDCLVFGERFEFAEDAEEVDALFGDGD